MNIPINTHMPELNHVDTPPPPQMQVDLAALEYAKAKLHGDTLQKLYDAMWRNIIRGNEFGQN
jgi:hypothetical protein